MVVSSQAERDTFLGGQPVAGWAIDILDFMGHSSGGSLYTQYLSGTELIHSHVLSHLVLTISLCGRYQYPEFTNK